MKLIHYSANAELKLNPATYIQPAHFKPNGLWLSAEDFIEDDIDWPVWCIQEDFRLENLAHKYEIKLNPGAPILRIETEPQLRNFTNHYATDRAPLYGRFNMINWQAVSRSYDGIIIAPYQHRCRLDPAYLWYYGWDCSSGCIWNLNVIQEIRPLAEKGENQNAIAPHES